MREHGLQSHKRRRFRVVTTDSKHAHPVAPNVLQRDFEATGPNQKWLADMTYVPTDEGWLYVALVLDLYARKLVGWAMSETMPQELTLCALDVALGWRDPDAGLVHHSDRGSQYAAKEYRKKLAARGITVSMSRKGDCWDNAPMESVNGTLKVECVHGVHFETREQARQAIVEYRLLQYRAAPFLAGQHCTGGIRAALGRRGPHEGSSRRFCGAPRYPPTAGSRFVASDRTGRPWITLIALRGVH
jgi:transposase InsO family protein